MMNDEKGKETITVTSPMHVTLNAVGGKVTITAKGDIIIQLGNHPVASLENYMQALGSFKKGDKTRVKFKRGNETREADIQF